MVLSWKRISLTRLQTRSFPKWQSLSILESCSNFALQDGFSLVLEYSKLWGIHCGPIQSHPSDFQPICRQCKPASSMLELYLSVVVNRGLSQKLKLLIYWSIYYPTLIFGPKLLIVTEIMRLWIEAAWINLFRRVSWVALRDSMRKLVIQKESRAVRALPGRISGDVFKPEE